MDMHVDLEWIWMDPAGPVWDPVQAEFPIVRCLLHDVTAARRDSLWTLSGHLY